MRKVILKNIYGKKVSIKIVENQNDADFITHAGTFHADEIMATVFLLNKFGSIKLARVNNVLNKDAFIYDIGFGKFDHHGTDFDEKRENGIKYASCGLVWKAFGCDIVKKLGIQNADEFANTIDKNLIMDIDRDDNGQSLGVDFPFKMQTIPNLISSFNPSWDDLTCENTKFLEAVNFCNTIFNNLIIKMKASRKAKAKIEEKIEESKNGILILDEYMPWKDIVLASTNPKAKDIMYAIFPSKRSGYNVVATPKEPGSFEVKKEFPESWAGQDEKTLQEISGIKTITFCHKGLFICACKTFEDAIKIAKISMDK